MVVCLMFFIQCSQHYNPESPIKEKSIQDTVRCGIGYQLRTRYTVCKKCKL